MDHHGKAHEAKFYQLKREDTRPTTAESGASAAHKLEDRDIEE